MAGTADALGYQNINTLEETESMPSFLEKQVATQRTIADKKAKQKEDAAKNISDLLSSEAKNAYLFTDAYKDAYSKWQNMVVDKFAKNPNNVYNVLNDPEVLQGQIDLENKVAVGKDAQNHFDQVEGKVRAMQNVSQEDKDKKISDLDALRKQVTSSTDPFKAYADNYGKIDELGSTPQKPFDPKPYYDNVGTITDPKDQNNTIVNPASIALNAHAMIDNEEGKKHAQKVWDDNPDKQGFWKEQTGKLGVKDPLFAAAYYDIYAHTKVIKGLSPLKEQEALENIAVGKSKEYANYNKTGVNITKTYNGGYTNGKDNLTPNKNIKQTDNDGYSFKPSETVVFNVDGKSQKINATEIVFNPKTKKIYVSGKNADGEDFEKNVDWDTNIDNMKAAANKMGMQGMIEQAIADSQGTTPTGTGKKQLPTK